MQFCKLDIRKATINTVLQETINNAIVKNVEGRYTYALIDDNYTIQIIDNKKAKSDYAANQIANSLSKKINSYEPTILRVVKKQFSRFDPILLEVFVNPEFIEYKFNELPANLKNNVKNDLSRDINFFNQDKLLFEQEQREQENDVDYEDKQSARKLKESIDTDNIFEADDVSKSIINDDGQYELPFTYDENIENDQDDNFLDIDPNITEPEFKRQLDKLDNISNIDDAGNIIDYEKEKAISIATTLADKLSKSMTQTYEVISESAAKEILKNTKSKYSGEPAFFFNNKVYFVEGNLTLNNVLHEFAHPLIKGIEENNRDLFDKLYISLLATPEGIEITNYIKDKYPELLENSLAYKREALVTSLELKGEKYSKKSKFGKFIDKLLFEIKKSIRNIFSSSVSSKINLNKLSQKTTLNELAYMLANEEFEIEAFTISKSDFAEFTKSNEIVDRINELKNVELEKLQLELNRIYTNNLMQINSIKQMPASVKELLNTEGGEQILDYIKDELSNYQTVNINSRNVQPDNVIAAIEDVENETRYRALALINSLTEIKAFTETIEKILENISNSKTQTNDSLSQILYYKGFLSNQENLITHLKRIGLDKDSLFFKTLNSIQDSVIISKDKIKDLEFKFITEFFLDKTELMQDNIEKLFSQRIANILKVEGYSEERIKTFIDNVLNTQDRENYKLKDLGLEDIGVRRAKYVVDAVNEYLFKRLGRNEIIQYLNGSKNDISFFSAWITPYSNIDDPIAGAFSQYLKTKVFEAQQAAQDKSDSILTELLPLLNAVNYNPNKINQLGDMLLFLDKTAYTDNAGEFKEKEVWTFVNKFKNYKYDLAFLQNKFNVARTNNDKQGMKDAYQEIQNFEEKYMNRKYTKKYYDIQNMFNTGTSLVNPITKEEIVISPQVAFDAYIERQNQLAKINTLKNVHFLELDDLYILGDVEEQARLDYNRLYDVNGLDGIPKKGQELERVLIRKKHRELSKNMYDYEPDTNRLQKDLNNYHNRLLAKGIDPEAAPLKGESINKYQKEIKKFLDLNFKVAYTPNYYAERSKILADIRQLTSKITDRKSKLFDNLPDLYKTRYNLAVSTSDVNGQPNGLNLTPEQIDLLKKIEDEILILENSFDKKTGLTKEESSKITFYINKSASGVALSQDELADYKKIIDIKNELGLSKIELAALKTKFSELRDLETKIPTEYYLEAFNYAIRDLNLPEINMENADSWINSDDLQTALSDPKFAKWFGRNHYQKQIFDIQTYKEDTKNFRISAWTMAVPNNPDHIYSTDIINPLTNKSEKVAGRPSGKYIRSTIKDEFLTIPKNKDNDSYVGTIIDNQGNFLPREYLPGNSNSAFDKKYQNDKYIDMKNAGGPEFDLLNAIVKATINIQKDKPITSRLYLDLPRFRRRSNVEYVVSGEAKTNVFERIGSAKELYKTLFGKAADDAEYGFNHDINQSLISTNLEGEVRSSVKIRGMYNLDQKLVSKDVLRNLFDYILSGEEQKILIETEPTVKSLISVLESNKIKDKSSIDEKVIQLTGEKKFIELEKNLRSDIIKVYADRILYGKLGGESEKKYAFWVKFLYGLMRRSSTAFIALDPQSAIKNRWGMLYQNAILAAGGKFVTPKSLAKGYIKSKESIAYWVFKDIYERGIKTKDIQLIERLDPTGMFERNFGKSTSRTIAKDLSDLTYALDFRRTMDFEAALELFWGMMYNKPINIKESTEDITYADAWETDANNVLKLKDGIDPEYDFKRVDHIYKSGDTFQSIADKYNITVDDVKKRSNISNLSELDYGDPITVGNMKQFLAMKLLLQGVQTKSAGLLNKFNSPAAEKFIAYRAFTFYKRFASGMFINKYQMDTDKGNVGGFTYNWDTNDLDKGYNISVFQNIMKLAKSLGKDMVLMDEAEKNAFRIVIVEQVGYLLMSVIIGSLYFGYDPDDEERFDKMKERSKTLPGQLGNHLLYLLIMTKMENEAFSPGPNVVKQTIKYGETTFIGIDNTLGLYLKIFKNLNDELFDQKATVYGQDVGPYTWQKKGEKKIYNNIGNIFGIKGKNTLKEGPIWAIKKYEAFNRD